MNSTYEPFSRERAYVEANQLFVQSLDLGRRERIVDLACGTGTLTELVQKEAPGRADGAFGPVPPGRVFGIDLSAEPIRLARRHLDGLGCTGGRPAALVQGSSERLPFADGSLDAAVMGNAIQLFEDKDLLTREVNRVLRTGGLFAFNTSFYAGSYLAGTEAFYRLWIEEAVRYIRRLAETRGPIPRQRGAARRAFSNRWLSPAEYGDLLGRNGFHVLSMRQRTVMLNRRSFEAIGGYAGLATVLLSGYPPALACEALQRAAGPALEASGMEAVPRGWLEATAGKDARVPDATAADSDVDD